MFEFFNGLGGDYDCRWDKLADAMENGAQFRCEYCGELNIPDRRYDMTCIDTLHLPCCGCEKEILNIGYPMAEHGREKIIDTDEVTVVRIYKSDKERPLHLVSSNTYDAWANSCEDWRNA